MARKLTDTEMETLKRSEFLLGYAAEHIKDLPQQLFTAISIALTAAQSDSWDDKIATDFWRAFNTLCDLIKPVTCDTLMLNSLTVPPSRLTFWKNNPQPRSLAKRSAHRYLCLLIYLLLSSVYLTFLSSHLNSLRSDIDGLIQSSNQIIKEIVAGTNSLYFDLGNKNFSKVDQKYQKSIAELQEKIQNLLSNKAKMLRKNKGLVGFSSFGLSAFKYEEVELYPPSNLEEVKQIILRYYEDRRNVINGTITYSPVAVAITTSLLPIFLGIMGACAYVIRSISEQIRESTFSSSSPIRHMVRVTIGGLAGVTIGIMGFGAGGSLSPSALAFIAGYAVEPVFSTFDSIAEKFKK